MPRPSVARAPREAGNWRADAARLRCPAMADRSHASRWLLAALLLVAVAL
jgi:hypothetical protein